jgi:ribosome maturation factor RimP
VSLFQLLEQSVVPLGYELVDLELAGGIVRVFIDWPAQKQARITIEDCELVSRQLSQVLLVEDIDYMRLEVSSPGVDRRLRRASDFERFLGHRISVRLRMPLGGRRNWEGELARAEGRSGDDWMLLLSEASGSGKTARRVSNRAKTKPSKKKLQQEGKPELGPESVSQHAADQAASVDVLHFGLNDIERAHLVPQLVF